MLVVIRSMTRLLKEHGRLIYFHASHETIRETKVCWQGILEKSIKYFYIIVFWYMFQTQCCHDIMPSCVFFRSRWKGQPFTPRKPQFKYYFYHWLRFVAYVLWLFTISTYIMNKFAIKTSIGRIEIPLRAMWKQYKTLMLAHFNFSLI